MKYFRRTYFLTSKFDALIFFILILVIVTCHSYALFAKETSKENTPEVKNLGPVVDRNIDYSPVGRKDPFESFVLELKKAQMSTMGNPLQRYELSQLKLIGIMSSIPVPRAMIEDPTGKGWIVKTGTSIGKHFGKVKKIGEDSIIVVEEYHDRFGKLTINEVEINMDSPVTKR